MTTEFTEITVVGDDDTGLIARITSLLFERGIDIEDLDQGPIVTQRAFNVPREVAASEPDVLDQTVERLQAIGQPLEAEALLEAVQLHLDDALSVHRGRTSLREVGDYDLGMTVVDREQLPTEPTDGFDPERLPAGE